MKSIEAHHFFVGESWKWNSKMDQIELAVANFHILHVLLEFFYASFSACRNTLTCFFLLAQTGQKAPVGFSCSQVLRHSNRTHRSWACNPPFVRVVYATCAFPLVGWGISIPMLDYWQLDEVH